MELSEAVIIALIFLSPLLYIFMLLKGNKVKEFFSILNIFLSKFSLKLNPTVKYIIIFIVGYFVSDLILGEETVKKIINTLTPIFVVSAVLCLIGNIELEINKVRNQLNDRIDNLEEKIEEKYQKK